MIKMVESNVPKHIGIIMDGNRRFAKRLMLKPWKGHEWGADKVRKVLHWASEKGVKEITFYSLSIENFNRPKEEFDYLMGIFEKECKFLLEDKEVEEKGLRINFIGRLNMLPESLREIMNKLMDKTKKNKKTIVNFAVAYGGRAEVIDAARLIAEKVVQGKLKIEDINEQVFSENLYIESEPDLIIRTSESRLSGFLPYQSTYSEIIFLEDKLWPELEKNDFDKCLEEYSRRKRRFGQ